MTGLRSLGSAIGGRLISDRERASFEGKPGSVPCRSSPTIHLGTRISRRPPPAPAARSDRRHRARRRRRVALERRGPEVGAADLGARPAPPARRGTPSSGAARGDRGGRPRSDDLATGDPAGAAPHSEEPVDGDAAPRRADPPASHPRGAAAGDPRQPGARHRRWRRPDLPARADAGGAGDPASAFRGRPGAPIRGPQRFARHLARGIAAGVRAARPLQATAADEPELTETLIDIFKRGEFTEVEIQYANGFSQKTQQLAALIAQLEKFGGRADQERAQRLRAGEPIGDPFNFVD